MADFTKIGASSPLSSAFTASAAAYSRGGAREAEKNARDALDGLAAERRESRVFKLGPLAVRVESSHTEPAPAATQQITAAAQRLADRVRAFNFQEALDAEEMLAEVHSPEDVLRRAAAASSGDAQKGAVAALEGMIAAAPQRTAAAAARSYGQTERSTRRYVPNMVNSRI